MDEPPFSGFLMSLNHSLQINGADEAVGLICVCIAPVRYSRGRSQAIGRPASQDNDLKDAGFLAEQASKPAHAIAITLHQLIIEHYRGLQVVCQGEAI
jgi:hypothetical protein